MENETPTLPTSPSPGFNLGENRPDAGKGVVASDSGPSVPVHDKSQPSGPNLASASMLGIARHFVPTLTAGDMVDILHRAKELDGDGEAVLFTHAQVMDTMFHRLTAQGMAPKCLGGATSYDQIDATYINLALRTQKQCLATIESFNTLKRHKKSIEKAK